MSGPCMITAAAELGFKELGTGYPVNGGRSVTLSHSDFDFWVFGSGSTLCAARKQAAEKAYGRYWKARLSANDGITKALRDHPLKGPEDA